MSEKEKTAIRHKIVSLLEESPILTGQEIIERFPGYSPSEISDCLLSMIFDRSLTVAKALEAQQ